MSVNSPIRSALVGYGLGGRAFHAPFLASMPQFSLDVIVTGNAERAAQARADHGTPVISTPDEVWARADEFDLAVVCTANAAHVPLARAALDRGLHVVVDKPLCGDAATGRALADQARANDRLIVTYQNRRWDGDFLTLRRLLAEGVLGDLYRFESRFERFRPMPKGGFRESSAPDDLGGQLYDIGSHVIDQALVLQGPAESVYAEVRARRAGADADDDAFVSVRHVGGGISHLSASLLPAAPGPRFRALGSLAAYTIDVLDPQEDALRADPRGVPAVGSATAWGVRSPDQDGLLHTADGATRLATDPGDYRLFWSGLADAITHGAASPVPIEQTIALLEVIDAARESAQTGTVVHLPG